MTVEDLEAEMQAASELQTEGQGETEVRATESAKVDEEETGVLDELTPDIEGQYLVRQFMNFCRHPIFYKRFTSGYKQNKII